VRNVLHVCEGGRGCCSHSCDTVRSETSTRMRAARHESAVLPTTGSQSPSLGRECGSADRSDSRPVGVSTVGPSAAKPITMPSHDGVPLHEYQRRAPVPPDSSQADPKQSVARLEVRALGCARLIAVSCCRSARFSKTNSRCPRSANACARAIAMSSSNIRRSRRASARKSTGTSFGEGQSSFDAMRPVGNKAARSPRPTLGSVS
jgi:hypothetical protein